MLVPRLLLSAGEPAGIGPDIVLQSAQCEFPAELIIVGDPTLFQERARLLGIDVQTDIIDLSQPPKASPPGHLKLLPLTLPVSCEPGRLNAANASYVIDVLRTCTTLCLSKKADALITGPIQKSVINEIAKNFTGHTEFLAELTGTQTPVMMLATEGLRVALVTTHMPLKQIAQNITQNRVIHTLTVLHQALQSQFHIASPRIMVTGLNPHAGENGHLGTEEIEHIIPAIQHCQQLGMEVTGPYPADTLFTPKYLQYCDAVLTMYHDQGLPVLKYKGFGNAINVTLGLPIIRTSVDHGTALELAGSGTSNPESLKLAINTAISMVSK